MRLTFIPFTRGKLVGVVLFALFSGSGCLHSAVPPEAPREPADRAAREAVISYAHRLAESFDDAGLQLEAETLTSAEDVNRHLQTLNAAVRKEAFQKLDALLNDEIGGEKWDTTHARQLFQHISSGLRSLP